MTVKSKFCNLEREPVDPIVQTMDLYNQDTNPSKIDVSIGVYKAEDGGSYTFPSVKMAKEILYKNDPGHNYHNMAGLPEYTSAARNVIFGAKFAEEGKIASLQTISGTGSLHMAVSFLKEAGYNNYYIGNPCWSNYTPLISRNGGKINFYEHYDEESKRINFEKVLDALKKAPAKSVFLFQACCHNPTGSDYTQEQWIEIRDLVKSRDLLPLFDAAYLGFASGNKDLDAWPIRLFYESNLEFLVCQSFSKNMGLYGERVGCLHVVVQDPEYVPNAQSVLVAIFRSECSFGPAFGARIAATIINNSELRTVWDMEVAEITERLKNIRKEVFNKLVELKTPGEWNHVTEQTGLFWYSGLSPEQNERLIKEHHVYSTSIGRVNIAGLSTKKIDYFCRAIDAVVRE